MNIKSYILAIVAILSVSDTFSQAIFAKGEELWSCTKMKLVVELLEEDQKYIDDLNNKISRKKNPDDIADLKDELKAHQRFVAEYNEKIKQAVEIAWTHNEKIEYLGESKVALLQARKEENVVVLFYGESDGYSINLLGKSYDPTSTLPTLSYSRTSTQNDRPDIYMYLPFSGHRSGSSIALGDLVFALKMMNRQMKVIFETGEKRIQLKELAEQDIEKNCIHLSDKTVKFDKHFIGQKQSLSTLDESFPGKLAESDIEEITKFIETGADEVVTIAMPFGINRGSVNNNEIKFMKTMVNTKTMEFYMSYGANGGESSDLYYTTKVFKKAISCK